MKKIFSLMLLAGVVSSSAFALIHTQRVGRSSGALAGATVATQGTTATTAAATALAAAKTALVTYNKLSATSAELKTALEGAINALAAPASGMITSSTAIGNVKKGAAAALDTAGTDLSTAASRGVTAS